MSLDALCRHDSPEKTDRIGLIYTYRKLAAVAPDLQEKSAVLALAEEVSRSGLRSVGKVEICDVFSDTSKMQESQSEIEVHVFVCTNQKKPGMACCASRGAEDLRRELKDWAKGLWGKRIRINASGCLDRCEEGVAVAIYPDGK